MRSVVFFLSLQGVLLVIVAQVRALRCAQLTKSMSTALQISATQVMMLTHAHSDECLRRAL